MLSINGHWGRMNNIYKKLQGIVVTENVEMDDGNNVNREVQERRNKNKNWCGKPRWNNLRCQTEEVYRGRQEVLAMRRRKSTDTNIKEDQN